MSSAVKVNDPVSRRSPTGMSSKKRIASALSRAGATGNEDRRDHLAQRFAGGIAHHGLEGDDARLRPALRKARLGHVDVEHEVIARPERREPAQLVDPG